MLRLQGSFLNPTELVDKLPSIVSFLGTHVWPKARDKWADKERLEPEREFTCVQCGAGYLESANGAGSCRFHERGMYNGAHVCCGAACGSAVDELKAGQETGCRRSRHRPKHHNDYTYVARIRRCAAIMNYTNTHEEWMAAKCEHYTGEDMSVSVGMLTSTRGASDEDAKGSLYVQVDGYADYFNVFPPAALSALQQELASGGSDVLVSHTRKDDGSTATLTWVMGGDGKQLSGIRAVVRAATSPPNCPSISELFFKLGTDVPGLACPPGTLATKIYFVGVRHLSRGGIRERFPLEGEEAGYGVRDVRWYKGVPIAEADPVEARKSFVAQHAQMGCPLRLKLTSPVVANKSSALQFDAFEAGLAIVSGQDKNVVVMEVTLAMLTAEGDPIGADVKFTSPTPATTNQQGESGGNPVSPPFTIPALGSLHLNASWRINTPDKHVLGRGLWDRAWLARRGPLLFQVTATTLEGPSVTAVMEFANPSRTLASPAVEGRERDSSSGQPGAAPGARTLVSAGISPPVLVVTCDSPEKWQRSQVKVERMDLPPPAGAPDSGNHENDGQGSNAVASAAAVGGANTDICVAGGDDPGRVVVAKVSCPGRLLELPVAALRALVYESMAADLAAAAAAGTLGDTDPDTSASSNTDGGTGVVGLAVSATPRPCGPRLRSVDAGLGTVNDGPIQITITALVDLALLRVYGLKVDMVAEGGQGASVALVRLPLYGGADPDIQPGGTAGNSMPAVGAVSGQALSGVPPGEGKSAEAPPEHMLGAAGERVPCGGPFPPFVPDTGFRDYAAAVQESKQVLARWREEHPVRLPEPPVEITPAASALAVPGGGAAAPATGPSLTEAQLEDVVAKLMGKITDVLTRHIPGGANNVGAAHSSDHGGERDRPGAAPSAVGSSWPPSHAGGASSVQKEREAPSGSPGPMVGVDIISNKLEEMEKKLLRLDDRVAELLLRLPPPGDHSGSPGGNRCEAWDSKGKQSGVTDSPKGDGKMKRSPLCSVQ
eukprot:jgi/Mesvir1/6977/Mv09118-RA.2